MGTETNYSKEKSNFKKSPLQNEKKNIFLMRLSKRAVLLIIALLAYVLTYTYIAAQYMYYKVPLNFLAFNNYRLLGISFIIFIVLILVFMLFKKVSGSIKETPKISRVEKSSIMGYAVIIIFLSVLFYLNIINFYAWLAFIIFSLLLLPFFPKNKTSIYPFSILALVSFLLLSAYLGRFTAEHKASYYVIKAQKQSYVVLDTYKDNYIIAEVNLKKKVINPEFQLVDNKSELFNKSKQTVLDFSYTGPLKVNK